MSRETMAETGLIQHMESYFGTIEAGWGLKENTDSAVEIVEFRTGFAAKAAVFSTLGMSSFPIKSADGEKQIRQEIFVMVRPGQRDARLSAVLKQIALERVRESKPVLRGEVIQRPGQIFLQFDFEAFYATLPIYYPKESWTFGEGDDEVMFCWLLPIRQMEHQFIQMRGWMPFEDKMDDAHFDLFDLDREDLV
jgi:Suppressor of fused protein (SUFU)